METVLLGNAFLEEVQKKDVADQKCLILFARCKLVLVMLDTNGNRYKTVIQLFWRGT